MNWFPVDKQVRNDWRVKAIKRRFGVAGVGQLLALWSFIASEGSQTDEGRGVQRDGQPLNLQAMAEDCDFLNEQLQPDVNGLRAFLDYLAEIGHIDAQTWTRDGIVFLPAMNRRLEAYRASKGRGLEPGQVRRPRGRPRKNPENAQGFSRDPARISTGKSANNNGNGAAGPSETLGKTASQGNPGNGGDNRDNPGKSGQTRVFLDSGSLFGSDPTQKIPEPPDPAVTIPTPKALVDLWNRARTPGPRCLGLTRARADRFRNALKETPDLSQWEAAIGYLNGAAWANAPGNGPNASWRADLDYLAKPGKVLKCLERIAATKLPTARTGAAVGRVSSSPGKYEAAEQAQRDGKL